MSLEYVNLEDVHRYAQTKTIEAARKHLCAVRDRSQTESEPHGRTLQQISATRLFHEDLVLLVTGLLGRLKAGGQLSLIGYGEGQGAIIASSYESFSEALPNFSAWSVSPPVVTQIVEGKNDLEKIFPPGGPNWRDFRAELHETFGMMMDEWKCLLSTG